MRAGLFALVVALVLAAATWYLWPSPAYAGAREDLSIVHKGDCGSGSAWWYVHNSGQRTVKAVVAVYIGSQAPQNSPWSISAGGDAKIHCDTMPGGGLGGQSVTIAIVSATY